MLLETLLTSHTMYAIADRLQISGKISLISLGGRGWKVALTAESSNCRRPHPPPPRPLDEYILKKP